MNSPEDQLLIKRSIAGNREAQGELYRKYVKAMYSIAIRMVPNRGVAADLTQDVFVKVFQELKKFRGEATMGAWIKRITINTCLSYLKKEGRLKQIELQEEILLPEEDQILIDTPVALKAIHEAIQTLPDGCRTVLSLFLLEGYKHREIAEVLNISLSTSKSQYHRGKKLLQEKLKTVYYHED